MPRQLYQNSAPRCSNSSVQPWTDYFVCNVYYHENNCVGEHSDSDIHWGAVDGESVILSYTYEQAGIMLVFPGTGQYQSDTTLMDYLYGTKDVCRTKGQQGQCIDNSVIEAILLRPNSLMVMGGFFQGQLVHETIFHRVIKKIGDRLLTKGDNNYLDDVGLYKPRKTMLEQNEMRAGVFGYIPFFGMITIWISQIPGLKALCMLYTAFSCFSS